MKLIITSLLPTLFFSLSLLIFGCSSANEGGSTGAESLQTEPAQPSTPPAKTDHIPGEMNSSAQRATATPSRTVHPVSGESNRQDLDTSERIPKATEIQYPILSGVGIALRSENNHVYANVIVSGSPADQSGQIVKGMKIISVEAEGKLTMLEGKTVAEAASLIRGPVGSEIKLTLLAPETQDSREVSLVRAPLELEGLSTANYASFIGKPCPEFKLISLEGNPTKQIVDQRGKILVLDFWATWCATCYAPVTKLQTLADKNPHWNEKVELITVAIDADLEKSRSVINKKNWHKTHNVAANSLQLDQLGIQVLPVIMIIAPDGTVTAMAGAHAIDVEQQVNSLLEKSAN